MTLDDYINGYIDDCVDEVRERLGLDQINLLGICQGGTFSLCYAALYPEKVKNLITMVAPVDFHVQDGLLNQWAGCSSGTGNIDVDRLVDAFGNIPGEFMNLGFLMMKPFQLGIRKYVDLIDILENEEKLRNFLRMEEWIFDSPDQAGEAFRQFIKDFYQGNKLIKGQVQIGKRQVALSKIRMPVLNVYAEEDHLVPPASSLALERYVGTKDYTLRSFPVGHIGMYVSGKAQHDLPPPSRTGFKREASCPLPPLPHLLSKTGLWVLVLLFFPCQPTLAAQNMAHCQPPPADVVFRLTSRCCVTMSGIIAWVVGEASQKGILCSIAPSSLFTAIRAMPVIGMNQERVLSNDS